MINNAAEIRKIEAAFGLAVSAAEGRKQSAIAMARRAFEAGDPDKMPERQPEYDRAILRAEHEYHNALATAALATLSGTATSSVANVNCYIKEI